MSKKASLSTLGKALLSVKNVERSGYFRRRVTGGEVLPKTVVSGDSAKDHEPAEGNLNISTCICQETNNAEAVLLENVDEFNEEPENYYSDVESSSDFHESDNEEDHLQMIREWALEFNVPHIAMKSLLKIFLW